MLRILALLIALAPVAAAEPYAAVRDRRPDLFHPETGYRIDRHRASTPDDIPGPARLISAAQAKALLARGALAIDVFGAAQSRYDELDGTWLVSKERLSLPGAIWLPETGRGVLDAAMQGYLAQTLARETKGDLARPMVVFCIADCWMSWNAAQRIAAMGYQNVHWFRHGTDGWLDIGEPLVPVDPVPVSVD
ncbi:MAG: PQQ-dependent catabolism-associated CXXCW motif protein [Rhodobacter sp.]|nr:PQQ-dependent catabolism-associated CXXCW motif protein [Rhodobacter sp.]